MKLLAPDILELTRSLSPVVCGGFFLIGLFLWLFGAASHRFWLALAVTLAAGLVGLHYGPDYDIQPLVGGLLLALAAGALALSLVRILLFVAGGLTCMALSQAVQTGWNDIICFLCGGLAGVFCYRLWINAVSSLGGSLLMSYSTLSLLDRLGKLASADWANRNGPLLNWAVAALTVTGMLVQFLIERRRKKGKKAKADKPAENTPPADGKKPWWRLPLTYRPQLPWRKAG